MGVINFIKDLLKKNWGDTCVYTFSSSTRLLDLLIVVVGGGAGLLDVVCVFITDVTLVFSTVSATEYGQ